MYYRNAQSALVVYDLTKPTSLIKARHWVAELQRQASPGIVIALVGNKLDLTSEGGGAESEGGNSSNDKSQDEDDERNPAEASDDVGGDDATRKVSTKEGREYAEDEGLLFFETSAKTGFNVQEVFTAIANAIPEAQMKGRGGAGAGTGAGAAGGQLALGSGSERVNLTGHKGDNNTGPKEGCAC